MGILVVQSNNREKLDAIKAVAKALKVSFTVKKVESRDSEFIDKFEPDSKGFK